MSSDARNQMYFEANKKSMGLAYVLWFFLGMLGVIDSMPAKAAPARPY
ncbi:MAG: TM2 domain-containing protein [Gemmatimonadota bacterium]